MVEEKMDIAESTKSPLSVTEIEERYGVDVTDFDNVRDKIIMTVSGSQKSETADMAAARPYKTIEDMTVFYAIALKESSHSELVSIPITKQMLREWDISPDEFVSIADKEAPKNTPYTFQGMSQVLGLSSDGLGGDEQEIMFVVTNESRCKGAGVIGYPDIFNEISDKLGGDFFVLPSSIHEFLVVVDNGDFKSCELEDMVKDVNSGFVKPEEVLTDHAYHYDSKAKLFEEVHEYDSRKEQEAAEQNKAEIENNDWQQIARRHRGR